MVRSCGCPAPGPRPWWQLTEPALGHGTDVDSGAIAAYPQACSACTSGPVQPCPWPVGALPPPATAPRSPRVLDTVECCRLPLSFHVACFLWDRLRAGTPQTRCGLLCPQQGARGIHIILLLVTSTLAIGLRRGLPGFPIGSQYFSL